jgi:hypothetical protein
MAGNFKTMIIKLAKDLEKEIGRLEKELKEKQTLLKNLKGVGKRRIIRRRRKPRAAVRARKVVVRRGRPPRKRGRAAMSNKDKVFRVMNKMGGEARFSDLTKAVKEKYPGFGGKNTGHAVHQILNKDPRFEKAKKGLYKIRPGAK